ncbi:DUF928 domain-containing protein [Calothrix membranacea FACHB-236]|nr:DUF928 domain-containing protein [Calothrix membranacea FACHB-236]
MNKARLLRFIVLINVLIANLCIAIPSEATVKKQYLQNLLLNTNNTYISLLLSDLLTIFRRQKVPAGGRGDICALAPQKLVEPGSSSSTKNNIPVEIWSLKPLFLWKIKQGTVKQIQLFKDGSNNDLWKGNGEIALGQTSIIYDGEPLQPGQLYHWRLHIPFPIEQPSFQIMEEKKRNEITNELKQIEARLNQQGASAETITLEKVDLFVKKNLWSDALREIFAVTNPSPEFKKIQQQLLSFEYCQTKD